MTPVVEEVAWAPLDGWVNWLARGWKLCGYGLPVQHAGHGYYSVLVHREVRA